MDEDKLTEQIKTYAELAKENPQVDVAALMMNALQSQPQNFISKKQKRWAYLVSLSAPPLGLFFALKFWFMDRDKADFKTVFWLTIFFNVITIVGLIVFLQLGFSSVPGASNITTQQLQQLPSDYKSLLQ